MDNLPAASIVDTEQFVTTQYVGFPVGYMDANIPFIYNHVNIILEYHSVEDGHRIVGFYVEPLSIKHAFSSPWNGKGSPPALTSCSPTKHVQYDNVKDHQKVTDGRIIYTYGVEWRPSDVLWASRWDVYLSMNHAVPDKVHWFSIINSVLIVVSKVVITSLDTMC